VEDQLWFFVVVILVASIAFAFSRNQIDSEVTLANARLGHPANVIASGFKLEKIAQGSDPLEKSLRSHYKVWLLK
jgi:hypothetical protein